MDENAEIVFEAEKEVGIRGHVTFGC
jgi:hypothetical protein